MASRDSYPNSVKLVADGRSRIVRDSIDAIRKEVEARYAEERARAGWLQRMIIRYRISQEIKLVLDRIAPRDALYVARRMAPRN